MTPKLTPEQREALARTTGPLPIMDEKTHRMYFLVDASVLASLQGQEDTAAIRDGIGDMEAGRVVPLDEVLARIHKSLHLSRD
jgi:predicted transcriptional regulator